MGSWLDYLGLTKLESAPAGNNDAAGLAQIGSAGKSEKNNNKEIIFDDKKEEIQVVGEKVSENETEFEFDSAVAAASDDLKKKKSEKNEKKLEVNGSEQQQQQAFSSFTRSLSSSPKQVLLVEENDFILKENGEQFSAGDNFLQKETEIEKKSAHFLPKYDIEKSGTQTESGPVSADDDAGPPTKNTETETETETEKLVKDEDPIPNGKTETVTEPLQKGGPSSSNNDPLSAGKLNPSPESVPISAPIITETKAHSKSASSSSSPSLKTIAPLSSSSSTFSSPAAFIPRTVFSNLIADTQASYYFPMEFFVAWQGVLTIAYSGIPPALEELKQKIDENFPFFVPENPGSKWPKTTLACLRDNKRLTLEQLQTLRKICSHESFRLIVCPPVLVNKLSTVIYESCCLEKIISSMETPLKGPPSKAESSPNQRSYTMGVLNEFSSKNLENYYFHASKDGHRSRHYRESKLGVTLVHFLEASVPAALEKFRAAVEAELPEMYDWFDPNSLHITLRALT